MKVLINCVSGTAWMRYGVIDLTPEEFEILKPAHGYTMNEDEISCPAVNAALIAIDMIMYEGEPSIDCYRDEPDIFQILEHFLYRKATLVTDINEIQNIKQFDAYLTCGWM